MADQPYTFDPEEIARAKRQSRATAANMLHEAYKAAPGGESAFNRMGPFGPGDVEGPAISKLERAVGKSAFQAQKISGLMGKALKYVNHPAAVAAMMLPTGIGIIKSLTRAARQAHEQDLYVNQLLDLEFKERAENRRRAQEQRQRGILRDENARRLAMYAPHLYNQVMAGRKLPKNAVVIGGTPRTDLLEELASSMADGAWGGD